MKPLSMSLLCGLLFSVLAYTHALRSGPVKVARSKVAPNQPIYSFQKQHVVISSRGIIRCRLLSRLYASAMGGGDEEDAQDPLLLLMEAGRGIVGSSAKSSKSHQESPVESSRYGANNGDTASEEVAELIKKRMAFRFEKNFEAADLVRDELLFSHQVTISDKLGIWKSEDGRSGSLKGYSERYTDKIVPAAPISCTLSEDYIDQRVNQRTHLRRKRMFTEADKIRDDLAANGVELMDASNEWRSYDGLLSGQQSTDW